MKQNALRHEFVEFIPPDLEAGVLYVSIPFATAAHQCCCGCGNKVITPLTPTDWKLIYNGESVSLSPSIGNWSFPCRSHYWVKRDRISWASQWSEEEVAAGRRRDKLAKQRQFTPPATKVLPTPVIEAAPALISSAAATAPIAAIGFWQSMRRWLRGLRGQSET